MMGMVTVDKTSDRLLTAYIINTCAQEYGIRFLSETKLQKLVFLSEKNLLDERVKAFDYNYKKFIYGPFSDELRDDLSIFATTTYIIEPYLQRSKKLVVLLEDFVDIFERNYEIIEVIDDVRARARYPKTIKIKNTLAIQVPSFHEGVAYE